MSVSVCSYVVTNQIQLRSEIDRTDLTADRVKAVSVSSGAPFYLLNMVPTGQGKLEKVREFSWSGKVRESQGKCRIA